MRNTIYLIIFLVFLAIGVAYYFRDAGIVDYHNGTLEIVTAHDVKLDPVVKMMTAGDAAGIKALDDQDIDDQIVATLDALDALERPDYPEIHHLYKMYVRYVENDVKLVGIIKVAKVLPDEEAKQTIQSEVLGYLTTVEVATDKVADARRRVVEKFDLAVE